MNLPMLDVALALIYIFFLLSLICTAFNELFSLVFRLRAKMLKDWLERTLKEKSKEFYEHPIIKSFFEKSIPSQIDPKQFASVLVDIVISGTKREPSAIETEMKKPGNEELKKILSVLYRQAGDKLDVFYQNIETWFNDSMDRLTIWYKKRIQIITLIFSCILVLVLNADTTNFISVLFGHPDRVQVIIQSADLIVKEAEEANAKIKPNIPVKRTPQNPNQLSSEDSRPASAADPSIEKEFTKNILQIKENLKNLKEAGIPIGFGTWENDISAWKQKYGKAFLVWLLFVLKKILGLLLTVCAVSLGAQFWFDMMKRLLPLRQAKEPAK